MNITKMVLGIISILLGTALIIGYEKFRKEYGSGGLSFKIRTGGIGFVMIGFYLIAIELSKII
ncbi:hypothetical protein [Sinomicrobium sp. M5D2P17]